MLYQLKTGDVLSLMVIHQPTIAHLLVLCIVSGEVGMPPLFSVLSGS